VGLARGRLLSSRQLDNMSQQATANAVEDLYCVA